MPIKTTPIVLIAAVVGAVGYAVIKNDSAPAAATAVAEPAAAAQPAAAPHAAGDLGSHASVDPNEPLPPNHPPIGATGSSAHGGGADLAPSDQEPAALKWTAPTGWTSMPNPNAMRLATYKLPRAAGDTEDAELSISRAGGDREANIKRWVDQFEDAGKEERRTKTVHGLTVSIVEVSGTYGGGMGPAAGAHKGWALMGAIVDTPGQPYFFKITGPAATVHAARKSFDAMLDGLTPGA